MNQALLSVTNLSVGIQRPKTKILVREVSFELAAGKTLALVGESGSGKTLTARALVRLLPDGVTLFSGSEVQFDHTTLMDLSEAKLRYKRGREIAFVFQEPMTALNPVMTVQAQIKEVLHRHFNYSRIQRQSRVLELLQQVGIDEPHLVAVCYPHQLSGGLRQRVSIAIALAGEPRLLIADELTTALDVTLQAQIIQLLKKLQAETGMAILLITHDLSVVRQIADYIIVAYQGQIVEHAEAKSFFISRNHSYSEKLFASLPEQLARVKSTAPQMVSPTLLQVSDLHVNYVLPRTQFRQKQQEFAAVNGVSFQVPKGKVVALVGESGSGKTTVAKAITGLVPIKSGVMTWRDETFDPTTSQARCQVQMIFQDPASAMNPRCAIDEVLLEGYLAQRLGSRAEGMKQAIYWLTQVGLSEDALNRYPHEFSGGQRQRIVIARALMLQPQLLVCDEPTSALDVSNQAQILQLLQELKESHDLSFLFITHHLAIVKAFADDVLVLHHGKLVESGPVDIIFSNPQHPYTQGLLAAMPQLSIFPRESDE